MKKIILSAALIATCFATKAQGLYFNLYTGYAIPAAGQAWETTNSTDNAGVQTLKVSKTSLGGGVPLGLRVGYMVAENWGLELGFNYGLVGNKITDDYTDNTNNETGTTKTNAKGYLSLQPAVKFVVMPSSSMKPYVRLGLNLPLTGKIITDENGTSPGGTSETTYETTGSMSIGLLGGFGVNFPINDKINIMAEINFLSQSIYSKKTTITTDKAVI